MTDVSDAVKMHKRSAACFFRKFWKFWRFKRPNLDKCHSDFCTLLKSESWLFIIIIIIIIIII